MSSGPAYQPRRAARESTLPLRHWHYHLHHWGEALAPTAERPLLVLAHGWMDVAASWQFVVDALAEARPIVAFDWRGFGQSTGPLQDSYWFADYLGDLDQLLDALSPQAPVDLVGHSMGGNIVMMYAGLRPQRIRRLVNMEGFGLPRSTPDMAAGHLVKWLDELKEPQGFQPRSNLADVIAKLLKTHTGLTPERAAWLAPYWSAQGPDGQWHVRGDPAHKRRNPYLYQVDEVLSLWRRISAPVLWMEGSRTQISQWWNGRYQRSDFDERIAQVPQLTRCVIEGSAHMLQFDQPAAVAAQLEAFLA
jgi:pimeloyl-ACP methyl ester carboxylesterase